MITPAQTLGAVLLQKPYSDNSSRLMDAQTFAFSISSALRFAPPFQSTVLSQAPLTQNVFIDTESVSSDSRAKNNGPPAQIDMEWLYENTAGLSVTSKLSQANSSQNYLFRLQKTSYLKIDFNYLTTAANAYTSSLRVQVTDLKSQKVLADNYGTAAQKEAYGKITSSEGLMANARTYSIKVSYAPAADMANEQSYNFTITSSSPKEDEDKSAVPEKADNALPLNDIRNFINPGASTVAASYLANPAKDGINDAPTHHSSIA